MTIVATVQIGANPAEDPADVLAAYVGNQLRGTASPEDIGGGIYRYFLTVFSDVLAGETVRFRVWDDSACTLYEATNQAVTFELDKHVGSIASPLPVATRNPLPGQQQLIPVNEGWTWISFNKVPFEGLRTNDVLGDLNPASGDVIKTQMDGVGQFATFDPDLGWAGTGGLDSLDVRFGYMIRLSEAGTILLEGTAATLGSPVIPYGTGWNWVGYVPQYATGVTNALSGFAPAARNGDVVKSQFAFAQFDSANAVWAGSLTQLEPGKGYKLHTKAGAGSFTYPVVTAAPSVPLLASAPVTSEPVGRGMIRPAAALDIPTAAQAGPDWELDARAFQYNMTVTAAVELESGEAGDGYRMGAFVNGELRGKADLRYVPGLGRYLAFIMVHSNGTGGEQVSFRLYDPGADEVLDLNEPLGFRADGIVGSLADPFRFTASFGGGVTGSAFLLGPNVPNPFRSGSPTRITYRLGVDARVDLVVFDVSGRVVSTLVSARQPAGEYTVNLDGKELPGGIYFYRLRAGDFTQVRKMVVVP